MLADSTMTAQYQKMLGLSKVCPSPSSECPYAEAGCELRGQRCGTCCVPSVPCWTEAEDHDDLDADGQGSTFEDEERSQDEVVRSRIDCSERVAVHGVVGRDVDVGIGKVAAASLPLELIASREVACTRPEAAHIPSLATHSSSVEVDAR